MSKLVIGVFVGIVVVSAGVMFVASRQEERLKRGSFVGPVSVGRLTPKAAEAALASWWQREQKREIKLAGKSLKHDGTHSLASLGITLDVPATIAKLPRARFLDFASGRPEPVHFKPVFQLSQDRVDAVAETLDATAKPPTPASVTFSDGHIQRIAEGPRVQVDRNALGKSILAAATDHNAVAVPMIEAPKHVPDQALASIQEVVSEFSTRFSTGKRSRCANIRLASSKLNGVVLMPGERVSFNGKVGRRTEKNGFQIAGVYKNGKHDVDVGGGICQVSTTLYNAALFANLKIVRRQNHSMPVAYVPLGRDATVDYGAIDLLVENNMDQPIALVSEYHPGKLTFRVLGQKDESLAVKIESDESQSWDPGTKTVVDPTLPAGSKKVVEKGTSGRSINTYRLVYRNGELIKREKLSRNYYRGGPKIIAVGPSQPQEKSPARLASAELD